MYFDTVVPEVLDKLLSQRPPPRVINFWLLEDKDKCHG